MDKTAIYFVAGTLLSVIGFLTSFVLSQTWGSIRRLEAKLDNAEERIVALETNLGIVGGNRK